MSHLTAEMVRVVSVLRGSYLTEGLPAEVFVVRSTFPCLRRQQFERLPDPAKQPSKRTQVKTRLTTFTSCWANSNNSKYNNGVES